MSSSRKAIIIGAGPAGLAAALRLQQQTNFSCVIYELRSEPTTLGGAVGIHPNGLRLMSRLGIYDDAASRGFSGTTITLHSLQGHIVGTEDINRQAKEETGFGYLRIKRTDLVDLLLTAVQKAGIEVRFGKQLTKIEESLEGVKATFSDGSVDTADLLLGCDGIHSFVRRAHVDPAKMSEYSGISALQTIIPMSRLKAETAAQVNGLEATLTEEGLLAMNPCTADKEELFVFFSEEMALPAGAETESRDGWEVTEKKAVEEFQGMLLNVLKNARGDWGDALRDIVGCTSVVKFHPVYRLAPGGLWSEGRVMLLGDAAHAMSPHAGQGVSMALEDIFLLSRLLADAARPLPEVFEKYEQIRRPRIGVIFEESAQNADSRKKSSPWGLWFKETTLPVLIGLLQLLGRPFFEVSKLEHVLYDIDEAEL